VFFVYTIQALYDLSHTRAAEYLQKFTYPWEALKGIKELILTLGAALDPQEFTEVAPQVWVHNTAKIAPTAYLGAPCIIGAGTEVRHCAFIRASALVGDGCVVGNSTELKNVILFDGVQVPHYNYVGDSVLGNFAHMGAGSICSNLKSDGKNVVIHGEQEYETGLRKIGAILGDHADIGCGCVLNPGTVVGKNTSVYPLTSLRGVYPADCIVKAQKEIVKRV
jgi:NDP-sugar pyrophosphorylase family protein